MRNVSLLTLRTRVRQRADIETSNTSASTRFPDAELNDHINEAIAELVDLERLAFDENYFRASTTFTTDGSRTYSLPADFLSMISCDIYTTNNVNGLRYSATKFQETERNMYQSAFAGYFPYGQPSMCRLYGNNIDFIPTPKAGILIGLNYVAVAPRLSNDSDTLDGVNGWEEFVVLDAAIKAKIKDQDWETVSALEGRKAMISKRIREVMSERDAGQAERVNDVRHLTRRSGWYW